MRLREQLRFPGWRDRQRGKVRVEQSWSEAQSVKDTEADGGGTKDPSPSLRYSELNLS